MKAIQPYLFFNGNCREAITFYGKALGAEPHIMTFADAPPQPGTNQEGCGEGADMAASQDRVMHANIRVGNAVLMASDVPVGQTAQGEGNFAVSIDCESEQEQDRFFASLSEGGKVMLPVGDTFWGARFGMLTDKFGVHWMFNLEQKK
ncbi:MAG: VOC family protein [Acidobacteria bacterium]|nr:VOC family protein [Acidobacteriota bacterium]